MAREVRASVVGKHHIYDVVRNPPGAIIGPATYDILERDTQRTVGGGDQTLDRALERAQEKAKG
jgi:hypothetical protein